MLFGFVVNKGITNIGRLFEILGTLYLIITLALCFLMLTQGTLENILPLYNPNEGKQFLSVAISYGFGLWRSGTPIHDSIYTE